MMIFIVSLLFLLNTLFGNLSETDFLHSSPSLSRRSVAEAINVRNRLSIKVTKPFPRTFENWDGHFSAQSFHTPEDKKELRNIQKSLQTAFFTLPSSLTEKLTSLEVRNQNHVSRGMSNGEKIIINTGFIKNNDELTSVFVHELGHTMDLEELHSINGGASEFRDNDKIIFKGDPSVYFYRISWKNATTKKSSIRISDFVSGYAATNPFEDFAESFLMYRLHGEIFRAQAQKSDILKQKYDFLKNNVFDGKEFQFGKSAPEIVLDGSLLWDATLLPLSNSIK
ncbi:hypothetical protein K9L63_03205 [Candidatus Gracilibacteria bacterium]|nr:hypothetical protein [Candidatus Gracilibacteria bacterium]